MNSCFFQDCWRFPHNVDVLHMHTNCIPHKPRSCVSPSLCPVFPLLNTPHNVANCFLISQNAHHLLVHLHVCSFKIVDVCCTTLAHSTNIVLVQFQHFFCHSEMVTTHSICPTSETKHPSTPFDENEDLHDKTWNFLFCCASIIFIMPLDATSTGVNNFQSKLVLVRFVEGTF